MQHEDGHSVMWALYGNSWPEGTTGGSHWIGMEWTLPNAWVEGWAEFMQCAVDNNPLNLQGNGQNIETNTWNTWQDAYYLDGQVIEGCIASILWDINDPVNIAGDDDHMSWGFDEIFTVLRYGDLGTDDNPNSILDFWTDWQSRWPDVSTSIGPLCDIYWNYGIDEDYLPWGQPWGGTISINAGATYTNSRTVTLTLSAADALSGVAWMRFSENMGAWGSWVAYATSYSYTLTSAGDGSKSVDVQFKDNAGNISPAWAYWDSIILDTTKPTGTIIIGSGNPPYTTTASVTLYLTYSDGGSGVKEVRYGNGGGIWGAWEAPAATKAWTLINPTVDGSKSVWYQVKDNADNICDQVGDYITLDTTAPTGSIIINSGNPPTTTTTAVTLYLTYSDATSGVYQVRYANAGESWTAWEAPAATKAWTLTSGDGLKTVYYQIKDNAGWTSATYSDTITLQTVPPAYLVVRGGDNRVWYRGYSGGVWGTWYPIASATGDSPAAAVLGGNLHIVARDMTGTQIWHGYVNLATNAFSGWTMISGSPVSAPTLTSNGAVLSLVVRGGDNRVWYRTYSGGVWGTWYPIASATGDSPGATMLGNNLHIIARNMAGTQIWHSYVDVTTNAFSGWTLISGSPVSKPTLTS